MKTNKDQKHIELTILCSDAFRYRELIEAEAYQHVTIVQCATEPEKVNCKQVKCLLASPSMAAVILDDCPNLHWCQSTWAGNAPLLNHPRKDYCLTGVKGVFGQQMREYVFTYLFHFARNVRAFTDQQLQQSWQTIPYEYVAGKTLGILGAGSIARALISPALAFDMNVIGLNSSGNSVPGFDKVFSAQQKETFARECDYVVNLLPDTAATNEFIDERFLAALPSHAVLINAGRGSAIDDESLLAALNHNQLRGAVLDVFKDEPLSVDHPYWLHPRVIVTQHTAAESRPEDIVALFLDNVERYVAGRPLRFQFDFEKGY
ncbi:D-2-hydroxyacid dehydrogenase [Alteromonas sp. ASW11-130]|uniref:D-2-hydroxyacid dehydrogenase n=1 Tax=Alteromonas sp. ASW11-130 TaxID=3015775 RepID=UPI0022424029|nr:D-2-hydroxyacid dehydrogenase [Alteromonas sp. ASW11-130]MCW8091712.1 D-2-hydroxyacid dehydrogenase [Alteromonas sp. ASW11-130]